MAVIIYLKTGQAVDLPDAVRVEGGHFNGVNSAGLTFYNSKDEEVAQFLTGETVGYTISRPPPSEYQLPPGAVGHLGT